MRDVSELPDPPPYSDEVIRNLTNHQPANAPNHPANQQVTGAKEARPAQTARKTTAAAAMKPVPGNTPPVWAASPTVRRAMAKAWDRLFITSLGSF